MKCGVQCLALPIILVSNRTMVIIVLPCPLNLHNTYISTYIHLILIYEYICTYVRSVCVYIYIYIYIYYAIVVYLKISKYMHTYSRTAHKYLLYSS